MLGPLSNQPTIFFFSFVRWELLDESGSASQVPQDTVQIAGYGSVVWARFLSEWLVDGAGLQ